MMRELDAVVLTRDVEPERLRRGDVGAVVHVYRDGQAFEVEFVTAEGCTVALLTLDAADVRPFEGGDVLHVRDFARA
jgi:hypothetical protein